MKMSILTLGRGTNRIWQHVESGIGSPWNYEHRTGNVEFRRQLVDRYIQPHGNLRK